MDLNKKALTRAFIAPIIVSAAQGVNFSVDERTRELPVYLCIVVCVFSVFAVVSLVRCHLPPCWELAFVIGSCAVIATCQHATTVLSDDPVYRGRSAAITSIIWKPLPAIFGFPVLPTAIFLCGLLLLDAGNSQMLKIRHGDPFEPRVMTSTVSYAVGFFLLAVMQAGRLCGIYDTQQALASERALMDSIIEMMCDAIVWLSEDGSTVVRTDQRFAMLVGRALMGERVASALAEEEVQRVQDCLKRAAGAPVLLPTTLVNKAGVRIPVDMFIVGNRNVNGAGGTEDQTPAFLIGIRITSRQGMEELEDVQVDMRQEHRDMLVQTQCAREGAPPAPDAVTLDLASSVPETTATGRIFDRVDVTRWLEGTPEDQVEELRKSLEKVDALGQVEHWLIDPQKLELKPNNILGSGAFGFVVGGTLHGSPIAVKVARHSQDASASCLVSIANEIRILRHVRHPNIVLFHGACVETVQGEVLLVLERVQGPDLYSYVVEHATHAEVGKRFQLLLDVACALRYLHATSPQIVHGDLKGSNVLVEDAVPRAKLVDFGLSRLLTKNAEPLGGSLAWMAPELILRPSTKPKPAADVFSFGRLTYMILACRKPLEGVQPDAIKQMIRLGIAHELVWEETVPLRQECSVLCRRMLSFAPEGRPDMREVHLAAVALQLRGIPLSADAPEGARAGSSSSPNPSFAGLAGALRLLRAALSAKAEVGRGAAGPRAQQAAVGEATAEPGQVGAVPRAQQAVVGEVQPGPPPKLALPGKMPTQLMAKTYMILDIMQQWNFPIPHDACCKYHAGLADLHRLCQKLLQGQCAPGFEPHSEFQCRHCGALDCSEHTACLICEKSVARGPRLENIVEAEQEDSPEAGHLLKL